MLRVVELSTGAALSCSLTRESLVSQVVVALKRRKSGLEDSQTSYALYCVYCDSKQRIRAKRLRGDDRPLVLVEHLKRTTGAAPKLTFTQEKLSARLVLASLEQESSLFAQRGIVLDGPNDAEFIHIIQRLGPGDACGFLLTNALDVVTKKAFTVDMWWVLMGEKLWFQPSYEDETRTHVHLADNKVLGPWGAEFELQAALHVYRLIAPNAKDAQMWVDCLKVRISLATENELISCADLLIGEEERALWKTSDALLCELESGSIDPWCRSNAAFLQLTSFARLDGTEYLLLFYADCASALQSSGTLAASSILSFARRFINLTNIPASLVSNRSELSKLIDSNAVSLLSLKMLQDAIRCELEQGMLARLRSKTLIYERLICDIPLLVERDLV